MLDTYDKNAEMRKKFKKSHGDGEDPIIIAQRFLNIFRQLHIFSKERKEAFNKMILEQPPEIRGMFSSLPGGSLLQEYVDDLEQSAGVVRDHSGEFVHETTSPELSEELSKAKILATALAEAQAQTAAKLQAEAPAQAQPTYVQPPQMTAAPAMSGNVKVVADSSFAKEIAAAFSQALKFSEDQIQTGNKQLAAAVIASQEKMAKIFAEKTDNSDLTKSIISSQEKMAQALADNALALQKLPIKSLGGGKETSLSGGGNNQEILDAIRESQDRMAQMIMQHNTMAASNSSNNNANNIQINTAPMPPMEDMVKGIVKAQSELFREMAQTQTKELSAIISVALKESQQLSSQTLAEAIEKIQKENRKFFEEQAKNAAKYQIQPIYVPEKNSSEVRHIPSDIEDDIKFQIPETNPSKANEELAELFSGENTVPMNNLTDVEKDVNEASDLSENSDSPLKKKKKKKKKKNKVLNGLEDSSGLDFSLFDDGAAQTASKIKEGLSSLASSLFKKDIKNNAEEDKKEAGISVADSSDIDLASSSYETQNVDDLILPDIEPAPKTENTEVAPAEEDSDWTWEEVPEETTDTPIEAAPETENTEVAPAEEDGDWTWEEVPEETTDTPIEAAPETESTEVAPAEEDSDWAWEEVPEETTDTPLEAAPEAENTEVAPTEEDSDWTWEEVPEETTNTPLEAAPEAENTEVAPAEEDSDWTWEEVPEETTDTPLEAAPEAENTEVAPAEDEGDWEWEEVPEETTDTPLEAAPEAENTEVAPAEDEGDWEWDYEEDTSPETAASEENNESPKDTASAEDEGDWEWDYEEDTSPETVESTKNGESPKDAASAEDEGDWEWDYEEDTSPETATSAENGESPKDATSAEDEGDWEWDYEEDTSSNNDTSAEQMKSSDKNIIFGDTETSDENNNPLYNGDLIFQDNLDASGTENTPFALGNLDFGIDEISKDKESKEPYAPKDEA